MAQSPWYSGELLAFDLETTGVDRFHDVPVSYALVTVTGGAVAASRAGLVDPGREIPAGATAVHGITTERARAEGAPLSEAISLIVEALCDAGHRGVPVVGMKLDYDLTIVDVQCRRLLGSSLCERGFSGPVLDAVVLDRHFDRYRKGKRTLEALCGHYGVTLSEAHDAAADASASAAVVLAMASAYPELSGAQLAELHQDQVGWHREWAEGYSSWRQSRGMTPLEERDFDWPLAVLAAGVPAA